ncbi:transaldolase [Cronobacter dublinensis]|uniref:transaldolase n=1 Tax=Cronobacter dublinensis TaxID=413497 RepID=UPI00300E106E
MTNNLYSLSNFTKIVADTGDISALRKYRPEDATTNPTIILKALDNPEYENIIKESVKWAKSVSLNQEKKVKAAADKIAVSMGVKLAELIPGRVSTEIDARLSFDTERSVEKARKLISLYNEFGIDKNRVLIKLAATWQGIKAAETLEKEGINCNLTLIFSFAQARACAEAGVYLISPFVGRILDWHLMHNKASTFHPDDDPGVISVREIYNFYKEFGFPTIVMGASFRNVQQIKALAGCDRLTISPPLLEELSRIEGSVERNLFPPRFNPDKPEKLTYEKFSWEHNQNPMAVEKLSEGIRNFAKDQEKLDRVLYDLI